MLNPQSSSVLTVHLDGRSGGDYTAGADEITRKLERDDIVGDSSALPSLMPTGAYDVPEHRFTTCRPGMCPRPQSSPRTHWNMTGLALKLSKQ